MRRSVIFFPEFCNMDVIHQIRSVYDPLANCIAPHITLVFPFDSGLMTEELRTHAVNALAGVGKFSVALQGITGDARDGYLFLNVMQGNDQIIDLHDRLYAGLLSPFLSRRMTYVPHLTVGRLREKEAFEHAAEALATMQDRFEAVIGKVYVERIGEDESSLIEFAVELQS